MPRLNPEDARICELWADGGGTYGSGYLIGGPLVLSSGHLATAAPDGDWQIRGLGEANWQHAELVWKGDDSLDAALFRINESWSGDETLVDFGRFAGSAGHRFRATGFPQSQRVRSSQDVETIAGEVQPLTARKRGRLALDVSTSVPKQRAKREPPWAGLSGAAVLVEGMLVGLVALTDPEYEGRRIEAVSSSDLVADAGFRDCYRANVGAAPRLAIVENAGLTLRKPYLPNRAKASSPSQHLLPEYGVVPFFERSEFLSKLEILIQSSDHGVSVATLSGPGGSGKSRTAAELCSRLETVEAPWTTGFFISAEGGDFEEALVGAVGPVLIVVDDAEGRRDDVAKMIALADRRPAGSRTVILLLSRRDPDELWRDIALRGFDEMGRVNLAGGVVVPDIEPSSTEREAAFDAAAAAFAPVFGDSTRVATTPNLEDPAFSKILFIHLAALTALDGEEGDARVPIDRRLVDGALDREALYWARTASAISVDSTVLRRAVGVAILSRAADEAELSKNLAVVPDLSEATNGTRREIARWLIGLYDDEGLDGDSVGSLKPDLLAEELASIVVRESPEILFGVLHELQLKDFSRATTVLNEAAKRDKDVEQLLEQVLMDSDADRFTASAVMAQTLGSPLTDVLVRVIERVEDPRIALPFVIELPIRSISVRPLSIAAVQRLIAAEDDFLVDELPPDVEHAARKMLLKLRCQVVLLLTEEERLDAARDAAEELVSSSRAAYSEDPGAFAANLLTALALGKSTLEKSGSTSDADEIADEMKQLVDANSELLATPLGQSIMQDPKNRDLVEQRAEWRFNAIERIRSRMSKEQGETDDYSRVAEFAANGNDLMSLARVSYLEGDFERALDEAASAVEFFQIMAEAEMDVIFQGLGEAQSLLSDFQTRSGKADDAARSQAEAVRAFRRLAELAPDGAHLVLAPALSTLAIRRIEVGDHEGAKEAANEALPLIIPKLEGGYSSGARKRMINAFGDAKLALTWRLLDRADSAGAFELAEDAVSVLASIGAKDSDACASLMALAARAAFAHDAFETADQRATESERIWRSDSSRDARGIARPLAGALMTSARARSRLENWSTAADAALAAADIYRAFTEVSEDGTSNQLVIALQIAAHALNEAERWEELDPVMDELDEIAEWNNPGSRAEE